MYKILWFVHVEKNMFVFSLMILPREQVSTIFCSLSEGGLRRCWRTPRSQGWRENSSKHMTGKRDWKKWVWYTLVLFPWRCDSTDKHNSKPFHQNWTSILPCTSQCSIVFHALSVKPDLPSRELKQPPSCKATHRIWAYMTLGVQD